MVFSEIIQKILLLFIDLFDLLLLLDVTYNVIRHDLSETRSSPDQVVDDQHGRVPARPDGPDQPEPQRSTTRTRTQ